jgi:serine/threonine protein kinase
MMILDDDIIIISDGKPLITNQNDEAGSEGAIGSYTIGQALGSGGFGEVCVGVNQITGERVALKFIEKSSIQSFMDAERAALEHRVLSSLNHRNIIKLISVSRGTLECECLYLLECLLVCSLASAGRGNLHDNIYELSLTSISWNVHCTLSIISATRDI